jgi:hypothetical protein
MPYVTDKTIENFKSQSIYGYRSGSKPTGDKPKNTCDQQITCFNPFDFKIEWRNRWVKVKKSKTSRSGKKYYYWSSIPVPYPYYTFEKQTRSIKEWRLILLAGSKTVSESGVRKKIPEVMKRLKYLADTLKRFGPCKALAFKAANVQHDCVAILSEVQDWPSEGSWTHTACNGSACITTSYGTYTWRGFSQRFWAPSGIELMGPTHTATDTTKQTLFKQKLTRVLMTEPLGIINNTYHASTLVAMLWPSSNDLESIDFTPLIDLSEAAADGVFPLGPPPSPTEAYDRMVSRQIGQEPLLKILLEEGLDFASNVWLWDVLVFEPVLSSAVGLSTCVKANDKAVEAYQKMANSGEWVKGKNFRLTDNYPNCQSEFLEYFENTTNSNSYGLYYTNDIEATVKVDKAEINAFMTYLPSFNASVQMGTSKQQLGQFFNRLSTSIDTIIHNLIPLSFVVDWFTSEYSADLNMQDKVYIPIADWKLILSYNLDVSINFQEKASAIYTKSVYQYKAGSSWIRHPTLKPGIRTKFSSPIYLSSNLRLSPDGDVELTLNQNPVERSKYYSRRVYNKPEARTDFENGINLPCAGSPKSDPLEGGKSVTLAALIWGIL